MKAPTYQQKAIRNQQVHTGPAGLNIPELPDDATDEQIIAALANLESAQKRLSAKRRALAEDAEGIFLPRNPKLSEEQAALQSAQIKGILKDTDKSITDHTGLHSFAE